MAGRIAVAADQAVMPESLDDMLIGANDRRARSAGDRDHCDRCAALRRAYGERARPHAAARSRSRTRGRHDSRGARPQRRRQEFDLAHIGWTARRAGGHRVSCRGGRSLAWARRELARTLGLLPQLVEDPFPATALEAVLVGRHPHLDFWAWESAADREIASRCLEAVDLAGLRSRATSRRSRAASGAGYRSRRYWRRTPARSCSTSRSSNSIRSISSTCCAAFVQLADAGRSVVMSLHDAGLAARFADTALLLFGDGRWLHGPCAPVLNEQDDRRVVRHAGARTALGRGPDFRRRLIPFQCGIECENAFNTTTPARIRHRPAQAAASSLWP